MRLLPLVLSTNLLAGCLVTAPAEEYTWTLKAPSAVVRAPHRRLHFTVETSMRDGRPVSEVPYVWVVDWAGLNGVEHQGRSFHEESLLVKGGIGTAVLRIFAGSDRLVEVARATFQVHGPEPVQP